MSLYEYKAAVHNRVRAEIEERRDKLETTSDHARADVIRGELRALRRVVDTILDEELQRFMRGGEGEDEEDDL